MFPWSLQLTSYWLPTMQEVLGTDHGKPVILVGNMVDKVTEESASPNHMDVSKQFFRFTIG